MSLTDGGDELRDLELPVVLPPVATTRRTKKPCHELPRILRSCCLRVGNTLRSCWRKTVNKKVLTSLCCGWTVIFLYSFRFLRDQIQELLSFRRQDDPVIPNLWVRFFKGPQEPAKEREVAIQLIALMICTCFQAFGSSDLLEYFVGGGAGMLLILPLLIQYNLDSIRLCLFLQSLSSFVLVVRCCINSTPAYLIEVDYWVPLLIIVCISFPSPSGWKYRSFLIVIGSIFIILILYRFQLIFLYEFMNDTLGTLLKIPRAKLTKENIVI
eukprot:GILJ01012826.1.p1 GENE.GILJ01012826.1~~GILJ01012826.1.p1  ORF type:complete len:269 (-),score=11.53 GILJ01012826.1:28-834(-)